MISKKAKYALKALKVLAQSYEKGPLLISHIAESENIPKKFLEAILLELRNHGILQSQKGKFINTCKSYRIMFLNLGIHCWNLIKKITTLFKPFLFSYVL
jgi:predicted transcriptional regulator